ncbi:cAMP-dependent kinase catalytic subunit PRKX [Brachionus plicatilis]|uniref:cAMP-dependent kinase catalytic subunit PRKX n=1 Tax=Brachionus plicatilis TaxID=10195 RepID=A0A3M7S3W3_BRAPC|nr:cAMP-dependent kinase catalytic subunit PRKX [Brachionus plicatilis]
MSKTVSIKDPSPLKYVKKPMLKSTMSTSAMSSQSNLSNYDNSQLFSYNLGDSLKSSSSSKLVPTPVVYQTQSNNGTPFYASSSANNSTGAALAVLNCASSLTNFSISDSPPPVSYEDKNDPNILEKFEFKTTVGTGTFGRVICVKHKEKKDYFALKIMSIAEVLRLKQTDHVKNEKEILNLVNHPFIIKLYWTHHNEKFLYMLCEFVCGGELFTYLRNCVKFSNDTANFYSAEIVCALEYLHSLSIIYRDLKPENLLLDRDGHIRICDFGFAKKVYDRTWTLCGTPEYLAPEIIQGKGHHKAVDWWALGILVFEMLAGYPPFYDEMPFQIYQKILSGKIEWPKFIDLTAKDLIKKLLVSDRTKRLGTMKNGVEDIKNHKWFRSVDWEAVPYKKLTPPIIPRVSHDGDTSRFDRYDEENWKDVQSVSAKNLEPFQDF